MQRLPHLLGLLVVIIGGGLLLPGLALAHRSGCHNLHTCPSDTSSYVCGDLGYPCDGSTSLEQISVDKINVPLVVESIFRETFDQKPTEAQSTYWKQRFRAGEKDSIYKLRRVMAWHKSQGSFGPKAAQRATSSRVSVKNINALFRSVYDGRNPTVTENQYWISRRADKQTTEALTGAMAWHKARGVLH